MKEDFSFQYIGEMPDFHELISAVDEVSDSDWLEYVERKMTKGIASISADTIPLIYDSKQKLNAYLKHYNYEIFRKHIESVSSMVYGFNGCSDVQQALITRLGPNSHIKRHMDRGPLTSKTHRVHVPILTNEKCIFSVGDEKRNIKAGEVWIIDNVGKYHSVSNNGDTYRIHLIIDIK